MSAPSAAKSAERIEGAILITRLFIPRKLRAVEADRREAVGTVAIRPTPEPAVRIEGQRKLVGRVDRELRPRPEKRAHDCLVLLGLERARRVDQPARVLHPRRRGGEDLGLLAAGRAEVGRLAPPL